VRLCGRSRRANPAHIRWGAAGSPWGSAVDPAGACFQAFKLKHDELLSNFAFNLKLRRYSPGADTGGEALVGGARAAAACSSAHDGGQRGQQQQRQQ